MKKKGIIIIALVIIVIAIVGGLLFVLNNKNNELSVITLDINPSIEMVLKGEKVEEVKALNNDGNELIDGLVGKTLKQSFEEIIDNVKKLNLVENGNVTIILGLENKNKKVEDTLRDACTKNDVSANIIVPVITEEAKNEAKAYGISPAKAAYIMETVKENEKLRFADMVNKSSNEINAIRETGKYCDEGYTLNGDFCEKFVKEERPKEGKTCPDGYEDVAAKCAKIGTFKNEEYCDNGQKLVNGKCTGEVAVAAKAKCDTGTYNSNSGKCEVLSYVNAGTKGCTGEDDLLLDNGKCATPHPGAHSYGDNDDPFDEATECCCGDTYHVSPNPNSPSQGWCYSPAGNYDATITCTTGSYTNGSNGKGCYTATTTEATYSCDEGKLSGSKCLVNKTTNPKVKRGCEDGYTLYEDRVCVNTNDAVEYTTGQTCEKEARLENNVCKYYEQVTPYDK